MPRQLITLEVDYPLIHRDDDNELYLRPDPNIWSWMSLCDEYDDPDSLDDRTYTRTVRVVQASAVVYTEADHQEAKEHGTTLLEMGVIE